MHVIGTAGHVDHGKSTLVQALTGMDPDRLAEEQERGLTIDLGFAWLTLPSGRDVSIVDVPGHEKFIKNMLAGAGGVDLALLVIAADEGPMPQTREHLAILDRLEIPAGIVVLTKADLVELDYLELIEVEVREMVAGSSMAGAPIVSVSALNGAGLGALVAALDAALDGVPQKRDLQRPRLPVDRAFTIQGFGTVVTGTLLDGSLRVGMQVDLQPGGGTARIRGLQRHKTVVDSLEPGTRAAVNLSGVEVGDVRRGMVVTTPGTLEPVFAVDVRLTAAASSRHPLAHDSMVTFLSGTAETEARVRLLDRDTLQKGDSAWAQVVMEAEVAVLAGDRCILRTPNETVAGGPIVAVNPRRHRRNDVATLQSLDRRLAGTPETRLVDLLAAGPIGVAEAERHLGIDRSTAEGAVAALSARGEASLTDGTLYGTAWLASIATALERAAAAHLADHPLRSGVAREHIRSQLRLVAADFDQVVAYATAASLIETSSRGDLRPEGYSVQLPPAVEREVSRFAEALRADPYSPPTTNMPAPSTLEYMETAGLVVRTRAGVVFDAAVFATMRERALAHASTSGQVTLAQVRDMFGTSRKYAQAFLEHLDDLKLTRRVGDARVLRES